MSLIYALLSSALHCSEQLYLQWPVLLMLLCRYIFLVQFGESAIYSFFILLLQVQADEITNERLWTLYFQHTADWVVISFMFSAWTRRSFRYAVYRVSHVHVLKSWIHLYSLFQFSSPC